MTVKGLCQIDRQDEVVKALWDGVVHQRPLVRAVTAGLFNVIIGMCKEDLLNVKVTPALVTLANDSDMLVRTATVPALGSLITDCQSRELHDKAYMSLQMLLTDAASSDNHALLRQLVVTMGNVSTSCTNAFKRDVILTQLSHITSNMNSNVNSTNVSNVNTSKKIDMTIALIEAYSNVIYSSNFDGHEDILPSLRILENVVNDNVNLHSYRDALSSLIKECEVRKMSMSTSTSMPASLSSSTSPILTSQSAVTSSPGNQMRLLGQNVKQNVNVEEMKAKMSNLKQASLSNLQSLFKKK